MIVILQVVKRNCLEIRLLISHTYIAMNTGACVAAYSFGISQCCPASSPPRRPFTIVMVDAPVASQTEWLLSKMKWINELMHNVVSESMNGTVQCSISRGQTHTGWLWLIFEDRFHFPLNFSRYQGNHLRVVGRRQYAHSSNTQPGRSSA